MEDETSGDVPEFSAFVRQEFMLRDDVTFLNHGSFGGMPRCVHERQVSYLQELESHPDLWFRVKLPDYFKAAVVTVADFIGTSPVDTFLLQNVTKATNTVLKTFPLAPGDAYLITTLTYCAVKIQSQAVTKRVQGANTYTLDIDLPISSEKDVIAKYEDFLETHPDVKLAVIDHITSPTAVVLPVKQLVEVCHRHDVIVIIDGAHAPGMLTLDLQDIDADFYTGTKDDIPYLCSIDGIRYYKRLGGKNMELMKVFLERFGIQTYFLNAQMVRISVQVYNTMENYIKLADAVLTLAKET